MSTNEFTFLKIIQKVRSNKTQTEISKLLGYNSNQYYKFECGLKKLKLKTFIQICEINQINIQFFFKTFLDLDVEHTDPYYLQSQVLKRFICYQDVNHYHFLKTSRSRWYRLKNCQTDLFFEELLKIIQHSGHSLEKVSQFFEYHLEY